MENKTLCFSEWTLCKKRNIWERWKVLEEENLKAWPILLVLWVKVGAAANVHPWWSLLLKASSKSQICLGLELTLLRGRADTEASRMGTQRSNIALLLFTAHVKLACVWRLSFIPFRSYQDPTVQGDIDTFCTTGCPKKLTNRMLPEPRCTG